MASKQHRTAGVDYTEIEIGGKTYTIRPLKVGVYAEMESYIASQRGDPLAEAAEACERVPEKHHQAIWDAAMRQAVERRTVSAQEAAEFENSIRGLGWKLWKCLEQDHPEINGVDAAIELITKAGTEHLERIARSVELGSGEADLGKSSGQPPKDPVTGTKEAPPAGP